MGTFPETSSLGCMQNCDDLLRVKNEVLVKVGKSEGMLEVRTNFFSHARLCHAFLPYERLFSPMNGAISVTTSVPVSSGPLPLPRSTVGNGQKLLLSRPAFTVKPPNSG